MVQRKFCVFQMGGCFALFRFPYVQMGRVAFCSLSGVFEGVFLSPAWAF